MNCNNCNTINTTINTTIDMSLLSSSISTLNTTNLNSTTLNSTTYSWYIDEENYTFFTIPRIIAITILVLVFLSIVATIIVYSIKNRYAQSYNETLMTIDFNEETELDILIKEDNLLTENNIVFKED